MTLEDIQTLKKILNAVDNSDVAGDKFVFTQILDAIERRIEKGFFGFVATTKFRSNLLKFLNSARIAAQVYGNDELIFFALKESHVENALVYIGHCKGFSADDFHIDFTKERELYEDRKTKESQQHKADFKYYLSENFKPARRKLLTDLIKQIYNRHKSTTTARKLLLAAFAVAGVSKRETLQKFSLLKPSTLAKFFQSISINFSDNPVDEPFTESEIDAAEKFVVKVIKEHYADEIPHDKALDFCYSLSPPDPTTRPAQYISETSAAMWHNYSLEFFRSYCEYCGLKPFTFPTDKRNFYDFYDVAESVHIMLEDELGRYPVMPKEYLARNPNIEKAIDTFDFSKDTVILVESEVDAQTVQDKIFEGATKYVERNFKIYRQ